MTNKIKEDPWGGYSQGIIMKDDVAETRWVTKAAGDGGTYRTLYAKLAGQWYAVDARNATLDGPTKYYGIRWDAARSEKEQLDAGAKSFIK